MSKHTGNRDGRAAKKRRARHRTRASKAWHERHLLVRREDGSYEVWDMVALKDALRQQYDKAMYPGPSPWADAGFGPIYMDECVDITPGVSVTFPLKGPNLGGLTITGLGAGKPRPPQ